MSARAWGAVAAAAAAVLAACQPGTTRPPFGPVPQARSIEIRVPRAEGTRLLAEALAADSIPLGRVELRDGYLESPWFAVDTRRPTRHRPLGPGTVRLHGWIDPGRPGYSLFTVETVFHRIADPSLPERELDEAVPPDHPVAKQVQATLTQLADRYGTPPGEPAPTAEPAAAPPPPER